MAFPSKLKELCSPAFIYFILSVIGIVASVISNLGGNSNIYTLGHFSTPVSNTWFVLIINIIYVLFWTWILNLMCKDGHREIAWFLVLLPFVLFFILMFTIGTSGMEGFSNFNPYNRESKSVVNFGKSQVDYYGQIGDTKTWKMYGNNNKQKQVWSTSFVKPAKKAEKEYNKSMEKGVEKGLDEAKKGVKKAGDTISNWFS